LAGLYRVIEKLAERRGIFFIESTYAITFHIVMRQLLRKIIRLRPGMAAGTNTRS